MRCGLPLRIVAELSLFVLLLCGPLPAVHAQAPAFLVKDLNTQPVPVSSNPRAFVTIGDITFFVADTDSRNALWKTDGTESGTTRLTGGFAMVGLLTNVSGTLFFVGADDSQRWQLWKSDGTASGTMPIKGISAPSRFFAPIDSQFIPVNGTLFFVVADLTTGFELWKSDGSTSGTVLLKDLGTTFPVLKELNGTLFFVAGDAATGHELWKSDGTRQGTMLVKTLNPGSEFSYAEFLGAVSDALILVVYTGEDTACELWSSDGTTSGTVLIARMPEWGRRLQNSVAEADGTLFFNAPVEGGSEALWKTDGTAAGTALVKPVAPLGLTAVNGTLFFVSQDDTNGFELWKSDGTPAGTVVVTDIGGGEEGSYPAFLSAANGVLFFFMQSYATGVELWTSDGTAGGTLRLASLTGVYAASDPHFTDVDGTLFFRVLDQLWKTDGTPAGTLLVMKTITEDALSGGPLFAASSGVLLFTGSDARTGVEPWKSDGTPEGTMLVANLAPEMSTILYGSNPFSFTNVDERLFFLADDGMHGVELWRSDGTQTGTAMVKDINPDAASAFVRSYADYDLGFLTAVNGTLFFLADDGASGMELWKSDGTESGTMRVADINPGPAGSAPHALTDVNGTLFYVADDGTSGMELWKSDGTESGTMRVADINPGPAGSAPYELTAADGTLFFLSGTELWKSDGSAAGTMPVTNFDIGTAGVLNTLTAVNGTLFIFTGNSLPDGVGTSPQSHVDLWRSDGSAADTMHVKSIEGVSGARAFAAVNDLLFFVARRFVYAPEGVAQVALWRSDGTDVGTFAVASDAHQRSFVVSPAPFYPTPFDGAVFFFNDYSFTAGDGLFRTDGTAAGTTLVKNLVGGSPMADVGGHLVFPAYASTGGDHRGLWESDGTAAGTRRLADIDGGPFTVAGPLVFFPADYASSGAELWAVPLASLGLCGNGMLDPGEACDDAGESAKCNADCTPACGDGTVDAAAGEECDDGNSRDGDCCAATCMFEPAASRCGDGNLCNGDETCDGTGLCQLGTPLECDDGNVYTVDSCDSSSGCIHTPSTGDCNADGVVTIEELLTMVHDALGDVRALSCPAGDASQDGRITVNELVAATNNALNGIPKPPCDFCDDLG